MKVAKFSLKPLMELCRIVAFGAEHGGAAPESFAFPPQDVATLS